MVILLLPEDKINFYFIWKDRVAVSNILKLYLFLSPLPNSNNYNPSVSFPLVLLVPGVALGPISSYLINIHSFMQSFTYYHLRTNSAIHPVVK